MRTINLLKNEIIKSLNFRKRVKINDKSFIVPVLKGIGINNLRLINDWFLNLLNNISLPENSTFIDVGVNVGQTILKFRSHYDNSYMGFEINSNCVRYSKKLIRANNFKNITIFPVGLSDKDELVVMNSNSDIDNCYSDSTIVSELRPDRYSDEDKSYVPVYKFDNLNILDSEDLISMVKIDVEGAELEVVNGMVEMIKKNRPLITCEILDYDSESTSKSLQTRANKLYDLIRSLNYDVYLIKHLTKTIEFEKISDIKLTRWTPASLKLNDYLFVPLGNQYIIPDN